MGMIEGDYCIVAGSKVLMEVRDVPPLLETFEAMAINQYWEGPFGWGQKQIDSHLAVDCLDLKMLIVFHNLVPRTGVEPVRG